MYVLSRPTGTDGFTNTSNLAWKVECLKICARYGVTWVEVTGPSRKVYLVHVRTKIARMLFDRNWSLSKIGRTLGNRDHTSIRQYVLKDCGRDFTDDELAALKRLAMGVRRTHCGNSNVRARLTDHGLLRPHSGNVNGKVCLTEFGRRVAKARCEL